MARNPKMRLNFDADVQYLLRMKHALEEDPDWPQEFREKVISQIVAMQLLLTNAPPRRGSFVPMAEDEDTPRKKRTRKAS
jgi:hypothetical protein